MTTVPSATLGGAAQALARMFDVALLDLDGVVYLGSHAVASAPEALSAARAAGMRLAFVTNNAARPPEAVAEHLTALGIPAQPAEVTTSAQAAAHYLADRLPTGAKVLVVGTTGLDDALGERRLVPVRSADEDPAAVVQGFSPELSWPQLAEGAVAIRRGVPWVATNVDPTVPSRRGPLPGNGSLVSALRHATGAQPVVTGKPDPRMHLESVQRSGARRPLVVGDRLDTDIEGANAAECPSLLVLTGVTTAADLLAAPAGLRPTYLARDLRGLFGTHAAAACSDGVARCGAWVAERSSDGTLTVGLAGNGAVHDAGDDGGQPDPDALDPFRALCVLAWNVADDGNAAEQLRCRSDVSQAAALLRELDLPS